MADPQSDFEAGRKAFIEEDLINSMALLESASNQGHLDAKVLLGYVLERAGENEQAIQLYRSAAEQGNPGGELVLGQRYASGEGVEQSFEEALMWINRAVDQEHPEALLFLGEMYELGGIGLEKDMQEATRLWRRAAELGNAHARQKLDAKQQP
jgi:TPR repeat protein